MNILTTLRPPIQEHDVSHLCTSSSFALKKMLSVPSSRACIDISGGLGVLFPCLCVVFWDGSGLK